MTHSILAVAVITPNSGSMNYARPFRDGFLTSRGTFQKFFSQDELRAYIEAVLGLKPIPVSTGIFFVFKEEQDEQEFLIRRFDSTRSLAVLPPSKRPAVIQNLERIGLSD